MEARNERVDEAKGGKRRQAKGEKCKGREGWRVCVRMRVRAGADCLGGAETVRVENQNLKIQFKIKKFILAAGAGCLGGGAPAEHVVPQDLVLLPQRPPRQRLPLLPQRAVEQQLRRASVANQINQNQTNRFKKRL